MVEQGDRSKNTCTESNRKPLTGSRISASWTRQQWYILFYPHHQSFIVLVRACWRAGQPLQEINSVGGALHIPEDPKWWQSRVYRSNRQCHRSNNRSSSSKVDTSSSSERQNQKTVALNSASATVAAAVLKWQCHEIFCFWLFSWISFLPAPEYPIRTFFENSRRYSQVKVHHKYQRHRWQICHWCQRHRLQILPLVLLVLLIPMVNLPPVSMTSVANNGNNIRLLRP